MTTINDDTDYRALYSKEHLGAWDLPEGRDAVVTIERIEAKELRNPTKKEIKPILFFKGKEKSLIVNATNGKIIASLYGTKVGAWKGKRIALYKTTTNGPGGQTVECVRVRPSIPEAKRAGESKPEEGQAS
jgi:hypothetical protein